MKVKRGDYVIYKDIIYYVICKKRNGNLIIERQGYNPIEVRSDDVEKMIYD